MSKFQPYFLMNYLCLFGLFFLCACAAPRNQRYTPPGCARLNDSLWIDRHPLKNIDYWEYLGWTLQARGRQSPEFRAAFPDTSGHGDLVKEALSDADPVLQHKTYFVPKERFDENLCCVSLSQMRDYAHWRTEIVYWGHLKNSKWLKKTKAGQPFVPHLLWEMFDAQELKRLPDIAVFELPDSLAARVSIFPQQRVPDGIRTTCRFMRPEDYLKAKK